ncbi:MAG: nitroreductase family deazaflavin-dependent oxidoreductase [Thermomicrobiales bacterium]|nr:nitroreductase family deazaflavin-dependent oxidoreductase [Thermomicrobiales bacterium]
MPAPRGLARFNHVVTNRILGPLARRLPGFGVVGHTGRKTGKSYQTPVNVFRRPGGYAIPLTYGPDADWVRNVLAADGATLLTRGNQIRLCHPRLIHDESRLVPAPVRIVLGLIGVADFLAFEACEDARPPTGRGDACVARRRRTERPILATSLPSSTLVADQPGRCRHRPYTRITTPLTSKSRPYGSAGMSPQASSVP